MDNFKVGCTVECIKPCDKKGLRGGKEYEIIGINQRNIEVLADNGSYMQFPKTRFKLVNYMYVWDGDNEKNAEKLEVVADLSTNPRYNSYCPIICILKNGTSEPFYHCKSIEQWEADNKPKHKAFTMKKFPLRLDGKE